MMYLLFVSAGLALGVVLGWFGAQRHKQISAANAVTNWQSRIIQRLAAAKSHISKKAAGVWVPSAKAWFFTRDLPGQSYDLGLYVGGKMQLFKASENSVRSSAAIPPMQNEKIRLYRLQAGKVVQLLLQAEPGDTPAYWVLANPAPTPVSGQEFKTIAPRRFKAFLTSPADTDAIACITAGCIIANNAATSNDFDINRTGLYYDRWRKRYYAVSPDGTTYSLPDVVGQGIKFNVRMSTCDIWQRFKLRIPQACLLSAPAIGSFALLTNFCVNCPEDIPAMYAKMQPDQQKVLGLAATYAAHLMMRHGEGNVTLARGVVETGDSTGKAQLVSVQTE